MIGAVVFAVVMVVGIPVGIMFGGAVWSALFGYVVGTDVEARHAGDPE